MGTDRPTLLRSRSPVSFGFLLTRHPVDRLSPIMPEVMRRLGERGARVEPIYPAEGAVDLGGLRVMHDLYVLKAGSELALSLAGALHVAGAAILNPYPVSAQCRDKIILSQILSRAGVPVPITLVASDRSQLHALLQDGPIVLKPYRGSQGRGVRLIRTTGELEAAEGIERPIFAQRYHRPRGRDRKLYCIGDHVFGVKRVWPARTYREKVGEPFAVGPELREIAQRCSAALGIGLFGFDVVETDDGPYVVDLSSFPGFKGVPDAARLLADHIWQAGLNAARGGDRAARPVVAAGAAAVGAAR